MTGGVIMGFRDQLAALIAGHPVREVKQSQVMKAILSVGNTAAKWTPITYDGAAREGFTRNAYVYASIKQIAMALAGARSRSVFHFRYTSGILHVPHKP